MTALAIINGVAVVVLVIVTGYYAWHTRGMAQEMREARLLTLLPKLVLEIEMVGPTYGEVVVRNVGSGPALDADLTLTFEPSDHAAVETRPWLEHVIAPGERHEFLPPADVGDMTAFAERHPTISLYGEISDALGQRHSVHEQIDIAQWWERLGNAAHRWQEEPTRRIARELESSRKELAKVDRRLNILASVAQAWWRGREDNR